MTKILGEYDITPSQFIILNFVNDNADDLSSAQLSRRFLMTPQSMNETVTTLHKKQMLEKYTDPNHKRIHRISLTEKGKETLKTCNAAMDKLEENLLETLTKQEVDVYRNLMGKILNKTRQTVAVPKNN
jgi:DNA-binding MarR family transcriptional regulator